MGYIIGGIAGALALLFIGVAFMFLMLPVSAPFAAALILLTVAAIAAVVVGLGLHNTLWRTGGARAVALLSVATAIAAWGIPVFLVVIQWYLRSLGMGWFALTFGWVGIVIFLIAGVGLLFRGTGSQGSPAWLVGFSVIAFTFAATNVAAISTYGEGVLKNDPITGQHAVKVCSFERGPANFAYPAWVSQPSCPYGQLVAENKEVSAKALTYSDWEDAGLMPGMSREEIISRYLCREKKEALLASAPTSQGVEQLEMLLTAEEQYDCSAMGDVKSVVAEQGGLSGMLSLFNVLMVGVVLVVALTIADAISRVGRTDGAPKPPGGH